MAVLCRASVATLIVMVMAACSQASSGDGGDGAATAGDGAAAEATFECVLFDPDDANAILTDDDGDPKVPGDLLASVLVDSGSPFPTDPDIRLGVVVFNVDGQLYSWAHAIDELIFFALDDQTEDALGFPQPPFTLDLDPAAVAAAQDCAAAGTFPDAEPVTDTGFDVEGWRQEAIDRFGEEEVYDDGSRTDYVDIAVDICDQSPADRDRMVTNLADRYDGSFQQFILEDFCPNV